MIYTFCFDSLTDLLKAVEAHFSAEDIKQPIRIGEIYGPSGFYGLGYEVVSEEVPAAPQEATTTWTTQTSMIPNFPLFAGVEYS
jgi:hypothetical protein